MKRAFYMVIGWAVWRSKVRELKANRAKLGAAAVVALVLIGGIAASKAASDS